ncbi:hypothetical protein [Salinisphaera sp. Q1T1-3]|uniref:hypothetical protein n=1 Tax=Salinisphaera sp. Q1T1-3 TaxID=2321229 RepID=UPI000E70B96D|nr:hypothetical protein [Salinisphaera sp. Q1T1-3]RJS94391.1 hypothetical protein D3260_04605 [Salinisphaera sp. Q1T1-3]
MTLRFERQETLESVDIAFRHNLDCQGLFTRPARAAPALIFLQDKASGAYGRHSGVANDNAGLRKK